MNSAIAGLPEKKRPSRLWVKLFTVALALFGLIMLRVPGQIRGYVYGLFLDVMRGQLLLATRRMDSISDRHFIIRFQPSDAADARLVLDAAEKFYTPVTRDFGVSVRQKIPVIVYPDRAELNASFGWPASENAMGVYWVGGIRVLSPRAWVKSGDPAEIKNTFESSGPMAHELTHLVVDCITRGNVPRWLTEGLAQYEEYRLTGFRFDLPQGTLKQPLYPLADMDREFDRLPNQALAYRESLSAVEYMYRVYGTQRVHKILQQLGEGRSINEALYNVTGLRLEQFEQRWHQSLADR